MPIRSLPSRPSLEYERKEAKALVRRLRAGDPDALARARTHHALDPSPARIRLADAQLVIAREYGFLSWPRLVHYFAEVARHQLTPRQLHGSLASFEASVRRMVAGHAARGTLSVARLPPTSRDSTACEWTMCSPNRSRRLMHASPWRA